MNWWTDYQERKQQAVLFRQAVAQLLAEVQQVDDQPLDLRIAMNLVRAHLGTEAPPRPAPPSASRSRGAGR